MSYRSRFRRRRSGRSRSDPSRDARHARRRDLAEHSPTPGGMDSQPAADEAGQSDAASSARRRRPPGAGRVPGNAPMMPRRDAVIDGNLQLLERTWAEPRGLYGWLTHVDAEASG